MGEVNSALETCGLRQNAGKLVILPNLRRTVENRKFSRSKQEYQIKASHRFLGIVCLAMLSMGAEIDKRIWATNRACRELYGMGAIQDQTDTLSRRCLRSLPHGPDCTSSPRLRLPSSAEMLGEKALGRTRPHEDPQLSPSVEKVAAGACIRALCTKAQMVPEHCQRARTSCALRIARYTHPEANGYANTGRPADAGFRP